MDIPTQRAFSLVELLVTLSVLTLVLALALPSVQGLAEGNRRATATQQLLGLLNQARALAISRQAMVSLCSGTGDCRQSRRWEGPLMLFADPAGVGQPSGGTAPLKVDSIPEGFAWHWSNARSQPHITYKASGITHGLNGTFTLCTQGRALQQIVISLSGRARTLSPANSAGCS